MIHFYGVTHNLQKIKDEYLKLLTKNEKEMLNIIIQTFNVDDYITMESLSEKIKKANSSIRNYFKKFTNKEILISIGENKGRKYKINKDILL